MDYKQRANQTYKSVQQQICQDIRKFQSFYAKYNEQKRAREKNYQPADRFAKQSVIATWAIAVLTAINIGVAVTQAIIYSGQLGIMKGQLKEMQGSGAQADKLINANVDLSSAANRSANTAADSLIATQRAYLGVTDANVIQPVLGQTIKGKVAYTNSGKEPAKFDANADEIIFSQDDWYGGQAATDLIQRQDACLLKKNIDGERYAWPISGFNSYFIGFPKGRIPQNGVYTWNQSSINGESIVAIEGCITYIAFSAIHHTAFCYFFDAAVTDVAHLNICTVGNKVD